MTGMKAGSTPREQNVLFINESRWMPGDTSTTEKQYATRTSLRSADSAFNLVRGAQLPSARHDKIISEDEAYLRNLLVTLRSLQAKIETETKQAEGEEEEPEFELELDTNMGDTDLSQIINLCLDSEDQELGLQVLFELFEHQELISTKVSKQLLVTVWDRLKHEEKFRGVSGAFLKRLQRFIS